MAGFDLTGNQNLANGQAAPRTDVMFQEFSLYIEGVQVPFMSINVQSTLTRTPRMTIQVPSQTGLMEICRYYEPKVHLFYKDPVNGNDCLFFAGNIVSTNYSKSSQSPGFKAISFNCEHSYAKMDLVTMDYSGYARDTNTSVTNYNDNEAAIKTNAFSSLQSISAALAGINPNKVGAGYEISIAGMQDTSNVPQWDSVPEYLRDVKYRFTGFPGIPLNLWNQLKAQTYVNSSQYEIMTRMYIPMVEEGLQFFRRLGGHYYIEDKNDDSRGDGCMKNASGDNKLETDPALIPPAHKTLMQSSIAKEIAIQVADAFKQPSGEFTSYLRILTDFMTSVEYDMVFLNAPAEVPKNPNEPDEGVETEAMDTIVKPQMPFYYAPTCNVVLPHMLNSLNIDQDEASVPTRVTAVNDNVPQSSGQFGVNYRAPQSVIEAVARGNAEIAKSTDHYCDLGRTTAAAEFKIGKFEQGRGIRHQKLQLPKWLAILAESMSNEAPGSSAQTPDPNSYEGLQIEKFRKAWHYRYDPTEQKKHLNPWDPSSNINEYQRMLFSAASYHFTAETTKARSGSVSMIFNPYIVPGYPMDIIDPTPTEPSFHAFCVEVSHTITARSISTNASFVSAMSYQELANYEQMYTHPWLQAVTDTVSEETDETGKTIYRTTIVNNVTARVTASEVYKSTLGVGAAAPEFLYDFETGRPYPFTRIDGAPSVRTEGSTSPHVSSEGNLGLVYRPIETKAQYEERFGVKFIDMSPDNYEPVVFAYTVPTLDEAKLMEPGESMFLDYTDEPAPSRDELKYQEDVAGENSEQTATPGA